MENSSLVIVDQVSSSDMSAGCRPMFNDAADSARETVTRSISLSYRLTGQAAVVDFPPNVELR